MPINKALSDISKMLNKQSDQKKQKLIAKWLSKYAYYLTTETSFKPSFLKRYQRGEIIMVDLGYRIGNEEGGPHYAVVLDKNNSPHSGIITILPLSSKKPTYTPNRYTLDLGSEIYDALNEKANKAFNNTFQVSSVSNNTVSSSAIASATVTASFSNNSFHKIMNEINLMKSGSIALISQITTVSKIRIIKPKRTTDPLSGIRLSDETLNKIDEKIIELYTGK
jgi:mRNA-degrading endonuclease toxin of MazEF toxin-antitoxin module